MFNNIILVGPRACGKTTVGRMLATQLHHHFVDTDEVLQRTTQRTVTQIVDQQGWEAFRVMESKVLRDIPLAGQVIATGGGMVLSARNRHYMKDIGQVFYLAASAACLVQRLTDDPVEGQRPSLTGLSIYDEIASILHTREALYRDAAHIIIDASQPPQQVISQILQQYQQNMVRNL